MPVKTLAPEKKLLPDFLKPNISTISLIFVAGGFYLKALLLFVPVLMLHPSLSYSQQKDTVIIAHFANNSFALNAGEIEKLGNYFTAHRNVVVLSVSGHADTVGIEKNNLILSARRSQYVVDWLKKYAGVQKPFVESFGETRPTSTSDNTLNRRVEISVRLTAKNDSAGAGTAAVIHKYSFDKLYFQPDKAALESYSLGYIDQIARILKSYPDARFEIRGHVNCPLTVDKNSGYMKKMNQLSFDRAHAVYEMLADRGISTTKMTYRGMGNTEMIFPNASTEEEQRKNMRVEILVLK